FEKKCIIFLENRIYFNIIKRLWNYEPISVTSHTSDPSQLKIVTKIDRIKRGVFAFSANVEWKYNADETTTVEAIVYRRSSGAAADYKLLPWSVPRQPYYEYLDHYYKDVVMKLFRHCSNLPQYEDKFEPPWPAQTYVVDKCVFGDTNGLPEVAPPGFYKVIFNFNGTDQPLWGFVVVLKITPKLY
ncbi:hypothetical protein KR038_008549, partial [Drosophila bunnanda]